MRVLHIQKATGLAGSEKHLCTLLSGLSSAGLDVKLIVLQDPSAPPTAFYSTLTRAGVRFASLNIRADYDLGILIPLVREIREYSPDIVHTHLLHADLYGTMAARLAGCRCIVSTRHNDDPFRKTWVIKRVMQLINSKINGAIYISKHLAEFYDKIGDSSVALRELIYYGLDFPPSLTRAEARHTLGLTDDQFVIGIVARLIPQKGHETLLSAFKLSLSAVKAPILAIIGDGELRASLEALASELGIKEHVRFLGFRSDAVSCIPAFDLFVHPSRWEGFGLAILEAMACGVPVISTKVSAIPEIITEESGVLVEADHPAALADTIKALFESPETRARLAEGAKARATQFFGVTKMVDATLDFYRKALLPL